MSDAVGVDVVLLFRQMMLQRFPGVPFDAQVSDVALVTECVLMTYTVSPAAAASSPYWMKIVANVQSTVLPLEKPGLRALNTTPFCVTVVVSCVTVPGAGHVGVAVVVPAVVTSHTHAFATKALDEPSVKAGAMRSPSVHARLLYDSTPEALST
jgi:hypothetical protein